MKIYENEIFDGERALYGSVGVELRGCRFDGEADGESALKESADIYAKDCFFNLRYPLWHNKNARIERAKMTELCRAALWYSDDVKISDSLLFGIKALRECSDTVIEGCEVRSAEFGWFCNGMSVRDTKIESEYLMLRTRGISFERVNMKGKYSFQYIEDSVFENCVFDTKDAFWHAKNVVVKNSVIKGEYLAWYSENVTFENCRIIGTQPLCYCRGLRLIDCVMEACDLAFERSEVEARLLEPVISIKNVRAGTVRVPSAEVIRDDENAVGKIIFE